ncbi:MAG: AAA-like domain-containing protein [Coleofasciculus chthonoplastes F3-SA18-01]|uniref:AAA-like domain-containing protein n=1 Tax=Coleofasciculus chthonoplastes TaxID=64178 RepID=UPI0032F60494
MKFNREQAVQIANQAVSDQTHRSLTDVEVIVLKGSWDRQEYDQIAAQNQYSTSYISQDVAPKLWKTLTDALGERVKKSNLKQVLEAYWQQKMAATDSTNPLSQNHNYPLPSASPKQQSTELCQTTPEAPAALTPDRYVERSPLETICAKTLSQPGALIRIKAPSLMGKTFLVTRVLAQLATQGYRTASVSLNLADSSKHFTNLDKFLRWLCINLTHELHLPNQLDEYWDEDYMGSKVSCTTYFEDYLLAQANTPLVLCFDDVDLLFPHPEVYEDFFGLMRSWYEKTRSRQRWKKLRLIIVHSTDVYIRLNINQSPFNVGLPIELSDFTPEQVQTFAQYHELEPDMSLIQPLMQMVGGHPYLLEQAFAHLKNYPEITLEQLLVEAPTEAGIYASHLRENWLHLRSHPELATAFKQVVTATIPIQLEPISAYQLQSLGLIKLSGNQIEPHCNLYRLYFHQYLGDIE